jgi:hypothetical protein
MIMSYKISHPKGRTQVNSSENSQKKNCETKTKCSRNLEKLQIEMS